MISSDEYGWDRGVGETCVVSPESAHVSEFGGTCHASKVCGVAHGLEVACADEKIGTEALGTLDLGKGGVDEVELSVRAADDGDFHDATARAGTGTGVGCGASGGLAMGDGARRCGEGFGRWR